MVNVENGDGQQCDTAIIRYWPTNSWFGGLKYGVLSNYELVWIGKYPTKLWLKVVSDQYNKINRRFI
jgi:hypothetical protein